MKALQFFLLSPLMLSAPALSALPAQDFLGETKEVSLGEQWDAENCVATIPGRPLSAGKDIAYDDGGDSDDDRDAKGTGK